MGLWNIALVKSLLCIAIFMIHIERTNAVLLEISLFTVFHISCLELHKLIYSILYFVDNELDFMLWPIQVQRILLFFFTSAFVFCKYLRQKSETKRR